MKGKKRFENYFLKKTPRNVVRDGKFYYRKSGIFLKGFFIDVKTYTIDLYDFVFPLFGVDEEFHLMFCSSIQRFDKTLVKDLFYENMLETFDEKFPNSFFDYDESEFLDVFSNMKINERNKYYLFYCGIVRLLNNNSTDSLGLFCESRNYLSVKTKIYCDDLIGYIQNGEKDLAIELVHSKIKIGEALFCLNN
jgi:hypothetical protein